MFRHIYSILVVINAVFSGPLVAADQYWARTGSLADHVTLPEGSNLAYYEWTHAKEPYKLFDALNIKPITKIKVKEGPYEREINTAPTKIVTDHRTYRVECKNEFKGTWMSVCYFETIGSREANPGRWRGINTMKTYGSGATALYDALQVRPTTDSRGTPVKTIEIGDWQDQEVDLTCSKGGCIFTEYWTRY